MGIEFVHEKWEGRTGSINAQGNREYEREFEIRTDSRGTAQKAVALATGVPRLGDKYSEDTGATVTSVEVTQLAEDPLMWRARIQYSTETGNQQDSTQKEDPLERPADIEWSFAQFTKPVWHDRKKEKAITNSADEPFDPPAEMDDSRPVLRISRNQISFSVALAVKFQDAVNSDSFFGGLPGQVKCQSITAQNQFENGRSFWRVTYEFQFRREGWKLRVLDRGFRMLVTKAGVEESVPISEDLVDSGDPDKITGNQPLATPKLLDGKGKLLPKGAVPIFIEYEVYTPQSFGELNLP